MQKNPHDAIHAKSTLNDEDDWLGTKGTEVNETNELVDENRVNRVNWTPEMARSWQIGKNRPTE